MCSSWAVSNNNLLLCVLHKDILRCWSTVYCLVESINSWSFFDKLLLVTADSLSLIFCVLSGVSMDVRKWNIKLLWMINYEGTNGLVVKFFYLWDCTYSDSNILINFSLFRSRHPILMSLKYTTQSRWRNKLFLVFIRITEFERQSYPYVGGSTRKEKPRQWISI